MTSTAAARRAYRGPALFSFGFRPFFLFGAIWSAAVVPLWLFSYFHGGSAALTREWHIHEMIFGFLGAVMAGFLTTAVPNWTGRMPVIGAPLGGLVALWALGRAAMLYQGVLGAAAAAIDSLFLLAFAAVVWREVLAGRNWRNLPVCGLVTLFAFGNVAFHLQAVLTDDLGVRLALGAASALIALIGGRIVPSFTRNWMKARSIAPQPSPFGSIDRLALGLTVAGAGLWIVAPQAAVSGVALGLAGVANLARLLRWRGWRAAAEPLVWILHVGYAWLGAGLLLLGIASLDPRPRAAFGRNARPGHGRCRGDDPGGHDARHPGPHRPSPRRGRRHAGDLRRDKPGRRDAGLRPVLRRERARPAQRVGAGLVAGLRRLRPRLWADAGEAAPGGLTFIKGPGRRRPMMRSAGQRAGHAAPSVPACRAPAPGAGRRAGGSRQG